MRERPTVAPDAAAPFDADGGSFSVHKWRGSGPPYVHVHHADDECWHVLEGALTFRIGEESVEAGAGASVFVPAGVPHTYQAAEGARYLVVLTPRLRRLIEELQRSDRSAHAEIFRRHESEILG
jgi:mannose-6-phosphate isomerase-like protein (cupin superfamily)